MNSYVRRIPLFISLGSPSRKIAGAELSILGGRGDDQADASQ